MADISDIKIGTSGFSFLDWIGSFYPKGIDKSKMLDHYCRYFDVVEINTSYYSIPHPKVFENMQKKTGEDFGFVVKVYKGMTHDRENVLGSVDKFRESIHPLIEAGKLRGTLLQFPYSFRWSQKHMTYVFRVADLLHDLVLFFEFRHRGWQREEVSERLDTAGLHLCSVDCPQIGSLPHPDFMHTGGRFYLRLHGRNAAQWWDGGALRYDYKYEEHELTRWLRKIRETKAEFKDKYMFFNNCHAGQAAQNARQMMEIVQRELKDEEAPDNDA